MAILKRTVRVIDDSSVTLSSIMCIEKKHVAHNISLQDYGGLTIVLVSPLYKFINPSMSI